MFAQVAGKDGQGYLMRMGDQLLRAQSGTPLQVGQSVQLRVQGEKGGNLQMQMLPGGSPARHNANEIATSLSSMKIPVNESSMETAKAMVENRVPLTKDNLQKMQQQTRMPEGATSNPPMPNRVAAVVFLQQNQQPVTPQNMASIANFLTQHPQVGQQMAAMNDELRRMVDRNADSKDFENIREMVLECIDAQSGGQLSKTGKKSSPPPPKRFFDAARQAGIELGLGPFPGGEEEDPWELLANYRELRRQTGDLLGEEETQELSRLLEDVEQNLTAQKLLNRNILGELGCLYFQVPLRWREDAEVWLYYRRRKGGQEDSLGEEFRAEFLVSTEHLGPLFFVVEVFEIDVSITIEVEQTPAIDFLSRYTAVLQDRISNNGWRCQPIQVTPRRTTPGNPWMQSENLTEMVSYDVQA